MLLNYFQNMFEKVLIKCLPLKGILCIIGGFCITLMTGSNYTFGNMMPYIVSYMRKSQSLNITYRFVCAYLLNLGRPYFCVLIFHPQKCKRRLDINVLNFIIVTLLKSTWRLACPVASFKS